MVVPMKITATALGESRTCPAWRSKTAAPPGCSWARRSGRYDSDGGFLREIAMTVMILRDIWRDIHGCGGFLILRCPSIWGYPDSWIVYFMESPIYKWMMTGGTRVPLFQEPPCGNIKISHKWKLMIGKICRNSDFPGKLYWWLQKDIEFWRLETETHCSHLTEEICCCLAKTMSNTQRLGHPSMYGFVWKWGIRGYTMRYLQMTIVIGKMVINQQILRPSRRCKELAQRFSCQKQLGSSFTSLRKTALLRRTARADGCSIHRWLSRNRWSKPE